MAIATRLACATLMIGMVACSPALPAAEPVIPSDEQLWNEAAQRIEQHRKADLTIQVVDATGHTLPGVEVHVEQTRHAFLFGCNIFQWDGVRDAQRQSAYRERFQEVLNFATTGFYWASYEPQRGHPKYDASQRVAQWCNAHGIRIKGHPLAWNYSDPQWLPDDSAEIFALQQKRIEDCIQHLRGQIETWDVVNEPTHVDRQEFLDRAPKLTRMWMEHGQLDFTKACFQTARRANPQATLLVNDYRTDEAYVRVIEQLLDPQGKPLYDVIGIQSHQHAGTWSNQKIWEVCQRFAQFGVPLHFTETTILSGKLDWRADEQQEAWPSTPEGEAYQARELERFYTLLYSHPSVEAITWWDFSDDGAWKHAPAGLLRADMTPKPAYETLKRLVRQQWWTDETLTTDGNGQAICRATYGDYQVTLSRSGMQPTAVRTTVSRDSQALLKVELGR